MAELSLPDFPTTASLDRRAALYRRNAADHKAGKHSGFTKFCKACREARDEKRKK